MEGHNDALERELFWKLQKKSEECRNLNLQIAKMDKGAAKANAEIDRLTAANKKMREALEQIAMFQGVDSYGHAEIARKVLKEAK